MPVVHYGPDGDPRLVGLLMSREKGGGGREMTHLSVVSAAWGFQRGASDGTERSNGEVSMRGRGRRGVRNDATRRAILTARASFRQQLENPGLAKYGTVGWGGRQGGPAQRSEPAVGSGDEDGSEDDVAMESISPESSTGPPDGIVSPSPSPSPFDWSTDKTPFWDRGSTIVIMTIASVVTAVIVLASCAIFLCSKNG